MDRDFKNALQYYSIDSLNFESCKRRKVTFEKTINIIITANLALSHRRNVIYSVLFHYKRRCTTATSTHMYHVSIEGL